MRCGRPRSLEKARGAYDQFCEAWATKYPKAVDCLRKDEQSLFSFYAFPAAHWVHLRTSNPIESTCATVRLRRTKGCGSRTATLTMVWEVGARGREDLAPTDGDDSARNLPLTLPGPQHP